MARLDEVRGLRIIAARRAGERWKEQQTAKVGGQNGGGAASLVESDTAERRAQYTLRESLRIRRAAAPGFSPAALLERQIGPTLDFTLLPPDEEARRAGRPVARIVELPQPGVLAQGFGTGFLVPGGLLLTNHHVLPSEAHAYGVGANFLHEMNSAGLQAGVIYELDPQSFFYNDEALDFALVALKQTANTPALGQFGSIPLIGATGKILKGHPISVIQHPAGGPKQYATMQNRLLHVLEEFLQYSTDTLQGSSGSPAFNRYWELVALHHSGVPHLVNGQIVAKDGSPWTDDMRDDDIMWVANEGVRVSRIVAHLQRVQFRHAAKDARLAELLRVTSDPLMTDPQSPESIDLGNASAAIPRGIVIQVAGNATMNFGVAAEAVPPPPVAPPVVAALPSGNGLEKKLRFDRNYGDRAGYQDDFLSVAIPLPGVTDERRPEMLRDGGKVRELKYHHFSLAMNSRRRLVMWSAVNVDYSPGRKSTRDRKEFGTDTWVPDPRIPAELQIQDDEFYQPATQIDRGHIVRREDNAWGDSEAEIEFANSDTFHWTNCTPQHERFNREMLHGRWGSLETHITDQIKANRHQASIFAGPVLAKDDPRRNFGSGSVQYPLRFWKVIAATSSDDDQLYVFGFLLDQSEQVRRFGIEALVFPTFRRQQMRLGAISALAGVTFPQVLLDADVMRNRGGESATWTELNEIYVPARSKAREGESLLTK
jgi:endonuclease G, mitochondrial